MMQVKLAGCLVGLAAVGMASLSSAAVFLVDRFDDPPPDLVCISNVANDCSLRDAILAANLSPGLDVIQLGAGTFTLSLPGAGELAGFAGDLNITDAVQIQGAGQTLTVIDAGGPAGLGDRVLQIALGIFVQVNDLTIRGGNCPFPGGGVITSGLVTMNRVTITDSRSSQWGGGIANDGGTLNLLDSIVSDNLAPRAGGIDSNGPLLVENSQVRGNIATGNSIFGGGGLLPYFADTTLRRSVVEGNSSLGIPGGGLFLEGGTLVIEDSSFTGNFDDLEVNGAGGIFNDGGDIDLVNSTLAHNTSPSYGVLFNNFGDVHFTNSTIIRNVGAQDFGGVAGSTTTLRDSAYDGDCGGTATYVSEGGNVYASGVACGAIFGDLTAIGDLMLSAVGNHGGSTLTAVPSPHSPVVDIALSCPPPDFDQRGEPRPVVSARAIGPTGCDAGAVEVQPDELDSLFSDGFEFGDTSAWSGAQ